MLEAILELSSELDLERLLQRVTELARELVGAEYAALGVVSADGRSLADFLHSGLTDAEVEAIGDLPRGRGILGELLHHPAPLRLSRLSEHPASVGFPPNHPEMTAFLGVPLEFRGKVSGNLYLTNKLAGGDFTAEDQAVVLALAAQAAVAIHNVRTYEREQELVAELRHLNQAKSDFVSTVSHELRSPITALSGLSQTLAHLRDTMTAEEVGECVAAIDRQAARLGRLVDDLLDLSRIESGRIDVDPVPVDVVDVLGSAVDGSAGVADVAVRVDTGLRAVLDPGRLDQIVVNLVTNAVRHGGPTVEVVAHRTEDPDGLEVVVRDDGDGVPSSLEPRLFERFGRGKGSTGSGLGLAISWALADAMGGTLTHRRVDGWTEFVLRLPSTMQTDRT